VQDQRTPGSETLGDVRQRGIQLELEKLANKDGGALLMAYVPLGINKAISKSQNVTKRLRPIMKIQQALYSLGRAHQNS
jgi:hypothetical protein